MCLNDANSVETDSLRYVPGPHSAPELAALDAALHVPKPKSQPTKARVLVGTAAFAVAVTIPDLSLGAMGSPYTRINVGEPVSGLPVAVWTPAVIPNGPVFSPVKKAVEIAQSALTVPVQPDDQGIDQALSLAPVQASSAQFDLAFAEFEQPFPMQLEMPGRSEPSLSPPAPSQALVEPRVAETAPGQLPPLAPLVEVPQITASRGRLAPRPGPMAATPTHALNLTSDSSVASTNASIEAAFAGAIDVSGAVRSSIPVAPRPQATRPDLVPEPIARAISIPAPDPALAVHAAAQAEIGHKTQLDARVNGVLAGSVDFRQLDGTIAIRLGSVLDMLRDRYSASEFERLSAGQSSNTFVTLGALQAAGIPISYNPAYDEVEFGIDYQDAPQAAKVQVEQIGASTLSPESVMIDQIIPR